MKTKHLVWTVAVLAAVLVGGFFFIGGMNTGSPNPIQPNNGNESVVELSDDELMDKFERALATIESEYVTETDRQQLIEGAINGMVETLNDPFSDYMDVSSATDFQQSLSSHFEGIGAEVGMIDGNVSIISPMRESPAEKAGLLPNDAIIAIDGESIEGWSVNEAVANIRGEGGTTVTLTIARNGVKDPFDVKIERDTIEVESVRADTFEQDGKKIGRLEITSFSEDVGTQFEEQLQTLEEDGIDGLVIDVRGNPGGYLEGATKIGDAIIPEGKPVVQIEHGNGEIDSYLSKMKGKKPYPVVGLINESSASASEILAAALKESGDYDLVGETTFGKGTVQKSIPMDDGSALKITTDRWLTAGGNTIDQEGVEPTVKQRQPDYFYAVALTVEETFVKDQVSDQIGNAQKMLTGLGFDVGRDDGYFDEKTEEAIIAFQQSHDLQANGELNEETAGKLQEDILSHIRDTANDEQLKRAVELAAEQASQ
ncbi:MULTISPECIES: S41 family peptidase [Shouchella]|uniref:Carboxyl-terminal processing protease n=2 Tax=Shouchella TaxID=2893057 RepID=Q5WDG4_SHOC1|nr:MULTISPECIES: S41 family peptidase [Shouchella]MCM3313530.1 S41 family peptidase [Psychrobacillus sp. MER TA 17]MCM3382158.1 S41 family peptidase [Shouchella rhizosphaerae]PAD13337.1 peptidase S41 [Shouchella clausii]PAE79306.1 peptidase S41 [Shouchella clausii]BAD65596.1 carboxyl-terminal processing protease [Shouchella clausii KSM-K16]